DLVVSRFQSLLGGGNEFASIDGAQRLQASGGSGHGDNSIGSFGHAQEKLEELSGDKRHVHREHQVQIGGRMQQGGMNGGEGGATGKDIGDHGSKVRESLGIADNGGIAASLGH